MATREEVEKFLNSFHTKLIQNYFPRRPWKEHASVGGAGNNADVQGECH